ncbi:LysE family translocator [Aureimonas jatrophae]|uniref:Threonine/homoserine/homoserine lactone efflux protein n=1 Tax=Aureimonas jatrophae TaxID=1166073 RepID=A0A1H0GSE6_9HYPH|nr:LysE family translocator [Aureimonas jatrophae]MBB3949749.1 threonine/homoserine/homoserine lactone efflux protein [Aureimonas jatrophae]SDO09817.1 Threonine/homoserine/homoserine lactone efflux protein [Aureimonas jatrophae]
MSADVFAALLAYAFVTSVTPGPNNMMLMASGVNFGFRRTIPHMLGIAVGFFVLLLAVGFGLGALIHAVPALQTAMRVASVAYMLWLAWKIATSKPAGEAQAGSRPMTFLQAAAFQWVNPKAWAMGLVAMGAYTNAENPVLSVLLVGTAFALVNFPSVSVWAGFGVALRGLLADPKRLRIFNVTMALLIVATLWPMLR